LHVPTAILAFADLNGADFTDAVLTDVSFLGTNLAGADLTRANLRGAKLRSDLPSFSDANLRGANLTDTKLDAATWPEDAPVPAGWKRTPALCGSHAVDDRMVDRAPITGLIKSTIPLDLDHRLLIESKFDMHEDIVLRRRRLRDPYGRRFVRLAYREERDKSSMIGVDICEVSTVGSSGIAAK
jgi:hypothetical protein